MTKKRYHLNLENLEQRQLLAADLWFADSGQSLGTNTDGAEFGDLDGDDDMDVLVGCRAWPGGDQCTETAVWLNDGNGRFSKGWTVEETNVGRFDLGDLDGDGDLDVFVAKGSPSAGGGQPTFGERDQRSQIWFNDGQGNFNDSGQRLENLDLSTRLADVDADGDLDALTANVIGVSSVWLNNGSGTFSDSGQDLAPQGAFAFDVGDVDGDGDLDAYLARGLDSRMDVLYLNDGHGTFANSGQRLDTSYTTAVRLADIDADGDLDVFVVNGDEPNGINQPNRVYFNDGTGVFTDSGQRLGNAISVSVELADLDGDGDLDAYVANGTRSFGRIIEQPNEIWFNDGSGVFTLGQGEGTAASYKVDLADTDNDGDLDAFIGNIGQTNQILINAQAIPLKGTIEAVENNIAEPPTLFVDGSGSGNSSALGSFAVTYQFEVAIATLTGSGQAQFVTANGETLFTDVTGQATPTEDPDVISIVETFTITSGTGRFAGASGSFTMERSLNQVTGVTSGAFDGTIQINTQPLRGDFEATENAVDPAQFPIFVQNGTGSGYATNLGHYTVTYQHQVDARSFVGHGSAHFISDNGDSLFTNIQATATDPALDPVATVVEMHTIAGGTGQFAGATGSFRLERLVDVRTGVTSGAFDGDILIAQSIAGDSNRDGIFNSSDLIQVFEAGEYEDNIAGNSTFEEGDWNRDGDFNSGDLVYAFQAGTWVAAAVLNSEFASAEPTNETLVAKRLGLTSDDLAGTNHVATVDQVFADMLL